MTNFIERRIKLINQETKVERRSRRKNQMKHLLQELHVEDHRNRLPLHRGDIDELVYRARAKKLSDVEIGRLFREIMM